MEDVSYLRTEFIEACVELKNYLEWLMSQPCPFIFQNLSIGQVVIGTFAVGLIFDLFYKIIQGDLYRDE